MRLTVFDTKVLVSAGLKLHSIPYRLVSDWALGGRVQLVACPAIVEEYREVLNRPKFIPHGFPPDWLNSLIEKSLQLTNPARWPHPLDDPTDEKFLALAKAAGASLITGNLKHFPENARQGVTVLSPAEYLQHLEGG